MPVYFVIVKQRQEPNLWLAIYDIVKTIKADIADREQVWKEYAMPILNLHTANVQMFIFTREEDNPFRESVNNDKKI